MKGFSAFLDKENHAVVITGSEGETKIAYDPRGLGLGEIAAILARNPDIMAGGLSGRDIEKRLKSGKEIMWVEHEKRS